MTDFGNVSDRVQITKDFFRSDTKYKKGETFYIHRSRIDSDNEIKISTIPNADDGAYVNIKYLTLRVSERSELEKWEFIVRHQSEIDFNLMLSDLTKKYPLMLVTTNTGDKIVLVHHSIISKAKKLRIKKPKVFSDKKNVMIIKGEYSEWISWAKKIKRAKWEETGSAKIKVSVVIPTI